MKKIISLLLVLALSLTVLSSMAFAAVSECDEADAVIKVTVEGSDDVYYMDGLDNTVVTWACKSLTSGRRTITLLKDVELLQEDAAMTSAYFSIPSNTAGWGNKHFGKLTFDLNGHTMSFTGEANLFYHLRWPFEVKNGTIIYENTASRFMVSSGAVTGETANGTPLEPWEPHIVFDNVDIFNRGTNGTPYLFRSNIYNTVYDITNCRIHCGVGGLVTFHKTTQASLTAVYDGPFAPVLNLADSVVYTDGDFLVNNKAGCDGAVVNATNTAFVTPGSILESSSTVKLNTTGELKESPDFSFTMSDGNKYIGLAYICGTVNGGTAAEQPLPFSDVKESDWFYSFVKELYTKGVVAGTTATTFAPNANLTYGAALKLLVVGLTGDDAGNASSGHWALNYLKTAVNAGWTNIDMSKLDTPITREAFCEIAAKAAGLTEQAENKFTDTQNPAVLALVKAGVINGMSETTFAPASILTRAQISKIISLLLKL